MAGIFSGIGSFLSSPVGGLLSNLFFGDRQQQQFGEFQRTQIDPLNRQLQGLAGRAGASTEAIQRAGLSRTLGSPLFDPNKIAESFGQERRDIMRMFNRQAGQTRADLIRRGLGSSTALGSANALLQRQLADSLGGLNARIFGAQSQGLQNQLSNLQGFGNLGLSSAQTAAGILGQQVFTPPQPFQPIAIQPYGG